MRKLWENKVSRRKLLGGAAATGAALPVLHELIPHQGLHGGDLGGAGGRRAPRTPAHRGSGHLGAVGRVDPRATASTRRRSCATSTRAWSAAACASGRSSPRTARSRWRPASSTRPGPTTAACPGPTLRAREGERLRINFVNGSKHPHTIHFHGIHRDLMRRHPGHRRRATSTPGGSTVYEFDATPFGLHLYHCHSTPLAEHIAKGLYGMFIIDPKAGRAAGRRARDGHERVRHELRPLERGLRRQHGRVRVHGRADPGEARRAGADLPRQRARVRPPQLVPHPRQLLRLLPDRHAARAARLHRHRDPGPGRARHPRAALPVHRASTCSTPTSPSSPSWAGWASSRSRTDGGRHRRSAAAPAWLAGLSRSSCWRPRSACSWRSTRPGLDRIGVPEEELAVERTVLRPGEIELHVRNDGADPVAGQAGDRQRRLRLVHPDRGRDRPARRRRGRRSSTPGSRARPTR